MAIGVLKSVAGKPGLERVHPDRLQFDPENPRFGGAVAGKTQPQIQQFIYGEPHYASELVDSLLVNGFIDYEPLVVKRAGGDKFVVIEGNRRLAAIKEIRSHIDRYPVRKSDLDSIPVLVFPPTQSRQQKSDMRVYLGVRHLMGFRQWPPLSKAQFLDRESELEGDIETVLKEVRVPKSEARRFLVPYRLLRTARMPLPDGEDFLDVGGSAWPLWSEELFGA